MRVIYDEKELEYIEKVNKGEIKKGHIIIDESAVGRQLGLQFIVKDPIKADIFIATLLSPMDSSLEDDLGITVKQLDIKPGMSAGGIRELRDKLCKVMEEYL